MNKWQIFLERNKLFLAFIFVFIVAEVIVNPYGDFPLNDDWSYAHAVIVLNKSGGINFGDFPSMTLYTHILWGALFTRFTGFSFVALRFASIVSAIIGFIFLNRLVTQISNHKIVGVFACLTLLFNPIFFSLSNTFMTDVDFNTLCIICCYLLYNYFVTYRIQYALFFIPAVISLMLVRQYGIVFAVSFTVASFFAREKKLLTIILAVVSLTATIVTLHIYEGYLKLHLPPQNTYKFSGNLQIQKIEFWENLMKIFIMRYREIALQFLVFSAPMSLLFLRSMVSRVSKRLGWILFVNSFVFTLLLLMGPKQSSTNIFNNLMIGPETFYESFKGARHNYYPRFDTIFWLLGLMLASLTTMVISLWLARDFIKSRVKIRHSFPMAVFLICAWLTYVLMILITESYFDRYHLPLITLTMLALVMMAAKYLPDTKLATVGLLFFALIAVFGTKDYLEWNRQRWNAYWYLRRELRVPADKINGGFEVNCWHEGESDGWRDFLNLSNFDYLIQFNPAEGFKAQKEFEFRRYLPFRKDKVVVFVREAMNDTTHHNLSASSQ